MSQNIKLEGPLSLRRNRVPGWAEIVSTSGWVQVAVLAGLIVLAYYSEIRYLTRAWYELDDWTHGWLIPVIGLYVIHINRSRIAKVQLRPSPLGIPLILLATGMYLWGIVYSFGYVRTFSLLFVLTGTVLLTGGWRLLLACWFPIFLLIFAIPLPSVGYFYATLPLRNIVTLLSTGVLNLLPDVYATRDGQVINYIYGTVTGQLNVEEACSGMRLLMAFLAMGAILAYLMREKPVWHRVTLLAMCVPIAILCNFIRVTVTSLLHVYGYKSLAMGGAHAALGLAMMVVALGLFSLTNWALSSLLAEGDEPDAGSEGGQA